MVEMQKQRARFKTRLASLAQEHELVPSFSLASVLRTCVILCAHFAQARTQQEHLKQTLRMQLAEALAAQEVYQKEAQTANLQLIQANQECSTLKQRVQELKQQVRTPREKVLFLCPLLCHY